MKLKELLQRKAARRRVSTKLKNRGDQSRSEESASLKKEPTERPGDRGACEQQSSSQGSE